MPIKKNVDCIIVDEIQLAADYERGHIFTDRILNARGSYETIFRIVFNEVNTIKIISKNKN